MSVLMQIVGSETCPLPEDPILAATATAFNDADQWVEIVDPGWCAVT